LRGKDLEVYAKERELALAGDRKEMSKKRKRKEKKKTEKARKKLDPSNSEVVEIEPAVEVEESSDSTSNGASPVLHKAHPTGEADPNPTIQDPDPAGYDETLLAVIGVLDEIKGQSNVAGWIRAGGLWGLPGDPGPSLMAGAVDDPSSPLTPTTQVVSGTGTGNDAVTTPDTNADKDADEKMWFDYEPTLRYWVRRGRAALGALGIEVVHGITG
jgi:hypothetical protein